MNKFPLELETLYTLIEKHRNALKKEDYETCAKIKNEVDNRIEDDNIELDDNGLVIVDSMSIGENEIIISAQINSECLNGLFDKLINRL